MAMIRGTARYAKIVGAPVEGFDGGEKSKEWTFDLVVDEETEEKLVGEGIAPTKFKSDPKSGERYINFKRKAYKADGTASKPFKIVDGRGVDWTPGVLIGNGSILNVKYNINEWEFGKKKGKRADAIAIQVFEHVPYENSGESFPINDKAVAEAW